VEPTLSPAARLGWFRCFGQQSSSKRRKPPQNRMVEPKGTAC
jgi:hypothetical protein